MTTIELLERTKAAWGSIRSASAEEKDRLPALSAVTMA